VSETLSKTPRERYFEMVQAAAASPRPVAEVGIPMRDRIELAADLYFPDRTEGPFPVVLTMTPYDKARLGTTAEARFYQENGYVFVAVELRGRGQSPGCVL
jgi:predicted acyl esterase